MDSDKHTESKGNARSAGNDPGGLDGLTEYLGLDPAQPDHDPLLGHDIGGVTILRPIAEGGMGKVYEGLQQKPKRSVAVKVIRPGFVSHDICRRFDNETEILGRLRHPYIAQIYSAGICSIVGAEVPYFVMEYVADALPITAYVKQHSLSTRLRLGLFRKVCEAVAHGHEKGVIHRDLKPSNILIEPSGFPKVIDFGIARCVDATPQQMTALTDIGHLIGTVQYMSPEQFSGDSSLIDVRSDVYALGVILYEILAGRPPYEISPKQIFEAAQVVRKHKPLPPSRLNKELSEQDVRIVGKCLQKQPGHRYINAAELAIAIDDSLTASNPNKGIARHNSDGSDTIRPVRRRISPLRAAIHMAGLSLLGLLLAALLSKRFSTSLGSMTNEALVQSSELAALAYCDATKSLSPAVAEALCHHLSGKIVEFRKLEALTPQAAAHLPPCLDLTFAALTSIADDTAAALASGSGALSMPGLSSITPTAASLLTKRRGNLRLDGLTSLSEELAKELANCSGDLTLNGLRELPLEIAGALAAHKYNLQLNGLQEISAHAAEALAQHQAESANAIDVSLPYEIRKMIGAVNTISLEGLTSLDVTAAKSLARFEGNLELDSLTVMTPDLAQAFSEHPGRLSLDGLRLLPEDTAKVLVQHDGDLSLGGLKTLRPEVAEILALHRHELSLNGIEWISAETARALGKHRSKVTLFGLMPMPESEKNKVREFLPNARFRFDFEPSVLDARLPEMP